MQIRGIIMRLKHSILDQYLSVVYFYHGSCKYKGKSSINESHCCNPQATEYKIRCREIRNDWYDKGAKGKSPAMPTPTVECEQCQYADLTLGAYEGLASLRTINRHAEGTIPVPLKGRKKVWLDNVNQKQLESVLDDIDWDIEAFAMSGSPTIKDFSFLERFPNLKIVNLWWNNKATTLWDMTKTPNLEYLFLEAINNLSDISQLANAKRLRFLFMYQGNDISNLKALDNHPSLEFIFWCRMTSVADLRHLITIPNLKYLDFMANVLEIDAYAQFEAMRPDVDTNFWEGVEGYADKENQYFTKLVGKRGRLVKPDDYAKQEKHRQKYLAIKQKYLTTD